MIAVDNTTDAGLFIAAAITGTTVVVAAVVTAVFSLLGRRDRRETARQVRPSNGETLAATVESHTKELSALRSDVSFIKQAVQFYIAAVQGNPAERFYDVVHDDQTDRELA